MSLRRFLKRIRQRFSRYDPAITVFISKKNLLHNLGEYKNKYPDISFAPVLKSNAYGHGLVEVAEILDKKDIAFFVLDSLQEAMILRKNGIQSAIQIVGFVSPINIHRSRLKGVAFTITSLDQLRELSEMLSRNIDIHLKIDTGMHRQGIVIDEIDEAIQIIESHQHLNLVGICSHFADADGESETFTRDQIELWREVVLRFKKQFPSLPYIHIAATAGTHFNDSHIGNVARLGLGLYGINASPHTIMDLRPALRVESVITSLRTIQAGESVGYNATYTASKEETIATIPVGYFEGLDRRLSNVGACIVGGTFCPIVGRVSMNISSIDVSCVIGVTFGQKVTVISDNPNDENGVQQIAKQAGTIPWEILVHIPAHLRRVVR